MTQTNHVAAPEIFSKVLAIRMLIGTAMGLALISFLVFSVPNPPAEWGAMWRVRPLIVTPLIGSLCGAGYHVVRCWFYQPGWQNTVGIILGVVGSIIGFWMGTIAGLHGTMWN
jgi:ABC-type dipeptide/oligopeptide/nickel transport system permease subunit